MEEVLFKWHNDIGVILTWKDRLNPSFPQEEAKPDSYLGAVECWMILEPFKSISWEI